MVKATEITKGGSVLKDGVLILFLEDLDSDRNVICLCDGTDIKVNVDTFLNIINSPEGSETWAARLIHQESMQKYGNSMKAAIANLYKSFFYAEEESLKHMMSLANKMKDEKGI
jgi:hypothetical protein